MNGVYIRELSLDEFVKRVMPFLDRDLPPDIDRPLDENYVRSILPLVKERARTLAEVADLISFFYQDKLDYSPAGLLIKGADLKVTLGAYEQAQKIIEKVPFRTSELEAEFRILADRLNLKPGQLFASLRIAVTGRTVSPPLFETMEVLGKERVESRLQDALAKLGTLQG